MADDFDEWLDDTDAGDDGELDQLNIDALLSAADAPAKPETDAGTSELDQTNIDALLGINNEPGETKENESDDMGELDQDNIDALLNGTDDTPAAEEADAGNEELDQDNIDALLSGSDDAEDLGELDQDNIDALLSGSDDAESDELDQDNIDALLSGSDDAESDELGQDNIDALLSGSDDAESDELGQDNIDALLSGSDDAESDELDQDNIDALLSGGNDTPAPAAEESDSDSDELDQDNIDALLSGSDDAEDLGELDQDNIDALLSGSDETDDIGELDQDNIDALLSGTSEEKAEDLGDDLAQDDLDDLFASTETEEPKAESDDAVPDDDIDALFNDIDAATSGDSASEDNGDGQSVDELFAEDDGGDKTTLSESDAEDLAETAFDSEFDEMDQLFSELEDDSSVEDDPFQSEEIDFAEMLDSSGEDGEDEFLSLGDDDEEEDFAMDSDSISDDTGNETDIDALLAEDDDDSPADTPKKKGFVVPAFISGMSKATMAAIGGSLVLLLLIGGYFMFSGDDAPEEMIAATETEGVVEENGEDPSAEELANFIPIAEDSSFSMDEGGSELAIELKATDEDGQPLLYEITKQPSYGRLSGTAPHFTYLANTNFPGEDSFEYTVNDGQDTSGVALVSISGPDLKGQALAQKIAEENQKQKTRAKEIKPKKPLVMAKNVHYYTDSTTPIKLDWRRIWQEANGSDYDPKVHVEIVKAETVGKLGTTTGSSTTFTPDPYSESTDLVFYRFKKNGFRSAIKTISIDITLGNPAPEVNIAALKDGYPVGQKVCIDAGQSRDDTPESLQFTWQQTAGSPVSMYLKDNGRKMSFMMPSSFYTQKESGPSFIVTVTDKTGKSSSKTITTTSISRRQAALWRGNNGGVDEDPAMKGQYFPWPYDD